MICSPRDNAAKCPKHFYSSSWAQTSDAPDRKESRTCQQGARIPGHRGGQEINFTDRKDAADSRFVLLLGSCKDL